MDGIHSELLFLCLLKRSCHLFKVAEIKNILYYLNAKTGGNLPECPKNIKTHRVKPVEGAQHKYECKIC